MKKMIVSLSAYLILTVSFKPISANEAVSAASENTENVNTEARVANYVSDLYKQIDFCENQLSFEAFNKAYRGYLNLRLAGKLENDNVITICDFSLASTEPRMWVIDLAQHKVLFNTHVAHGKGSGDTYASKFSNKKDSHMSSLGFYVTGSTYKGKRGLSLRLNGMDEGFNDKALDRAVVVHGSKYVGEKYAEANNTLGRSLGCPAVSAKLAQPIINHIKDGSCMFIYYPDAKYQQAGYWMNKKLDHLPETMLNEMAMVIPAKPKTRTIQYITNGKVDSVVTLPLVGQ
jgi:hypothetical protein